jgi:ribonuclease R
MSERRKGRARKKTAAKRPSGPPDPVRGSYIGHPKGFGFLVLDEGGADLFVPPDAEGDALDGDSVEAQRGDRGTARVTRVLDRGRKLLVGTYLGNGKFQADAHRIPQDLTVEGKARRGDKVLVAVAKTKLRVRRVLGRAGAPQVEDAAVLAELEIAPRFPKDVQAAARALAAPSGRDYRRRLDLRKATTVVTIDPVTSKDFDDAISLERRGKDWLLGVHIADVSHYVLPDSPLDREAYRRGTSIYLPGRVIPMLPEKLSNDLCSLREGVDRLAMTVLMRYGPKGELRETTFAESVIRSDRRFSYERASRVMDRAVREKGAVGALLLDMVRLSKLLARKRPSLDLPRGEIELVYGGQGEVVDLRPTSQDVAHGVIEEFMLAANREVARLFLRRRVPAIYRHHPQAPDLSRVWDDFRSLGIRRAESLGLGKAMAAAITKGYGPAAAAAVLRCMPRAIYTTRDASHASLGFEAYTHFTSPIRRYSDLVVHRELRALLRKGRGPIRMRSSAKLPAPLPNETLEAVAAHATERAISADRAENRIRRRRLLEYLARQRPETLAGQVTQVVERGFSVDLPPYGTWGFVPLDQLPRGRYALEDGALRSARHTFRLGDTLDVRISRIDPASNELELKPA